MFLRVVFAVLVVFSIDSMASADCGVSIEQSPCSNVGEPSNDKCETKNCVWNPFLFKFTCYQPQEGCEYTENSYDTVTGPGDQEINEDEYVDCIVCVDCKLCSPGTSPHCLEGDNWYVEVDMVDHISVTCD